MDVDEYSAQQQVALADGVEISYRVAGPTGGPVMVLLHGLGEGAASWDPVTPALAAGHRVYALDLRGHGASSWPGRYTFEAMRDDVAALIDALGRGAVVVVGHSMGGVVAYLLTLDRPDLITALVVEDAPLPFPRTRALPQRPDGDLPFDWDVVVAVNEQVDDPTMRWWPRLGEIGAPMLLIAGGPASTIPQHLLAQVAAAVPNCTLVTIKAGHHVHESEPAAFTEAVIDWLERAAP